MSNAKIRRDADASNLIESLFPIDSVPDAYRNGWADWQAGERPGWLVWEIREGFAEDYPEDPDEFEVACDIVEATIAGIVIVTEWGKGWNNRLDRDRVIALARELATRFGYPAWRVGSEAAGTTRKAATLSDPSWVRGFYTIGHTAGGRYWSSGLPWR